MQHRRLEGYHGFGSTDSEKISVRGPFLYVKIATYKDSPRAERVKIIKKYSQKLALLLIFTF